MAKANETGDDAEEEDLEDDDSEESDDDKDSKDDDDSKADDKSDDDDEESEDDSDDDDDSKNRKSKKSDDPLDGIDDPEQLRKQAKKFRSIAQRKGSKTQQNDKSGEKREKKPVASEQEADMTSRDVLALSNAGVKEEEDIDEVVEYAKFKKISVAKALRTPYIQTTLKDRAEERQTADATNTGGGRRGSQKLSDDAILDNARKGKLPDNIDDLVAARAKARRKKHK